MDALETYQARYRRDVIYVLLSDRTQNGRGNCAFMLLCYSESGRWVMRRLSCFTAAWQGIDA